MHDARGPVVRLDDLDPAGAKLVDATRSLDVRIARADDDTCDAGGDDRVRARRRRAVVRARLERDVHGRAPRTRARCGKCDDLGMAPLGLGHAFTDRLAVTDDHGADRRLRVRPLRALARELDRPLEAHCTACASLRYA